LKEKGGCELSHSRESIETRKIQFTGGSTFIISLPKNWIGQNQLKKGSVIKLREEDNGVLSIVPPNSLRQETLEDATIKTFAKDSPEAIQRKTVAAYLAGFNSINIRADKQQPLSTKLRHETKVFVRRFLVGTEIVADTPPQLTLQVLLSYPELTIQNVIRRMGIITMSMHKNAILALKQHDSFLARDVITTDSEVDRFNLFMIRQIKRALQNPRMIKDIGLDSGRDCLAFRLVTKSVERTADHAVSIAENVISLKHEVSKETAESIEKISNFATSTFEKAMDALFRKDYNLAEEIIEKTDQTAKLESEAVAASQMDLENAANLRMIIGSIKRTAEYASDIAEIVLDLTIESVLA
jgi:phosphate uptake regulator